MKYLITGGTGLIGSRLVDFLINQKHDVTILTRSPQKVRPDCAPIKDISEINDEQKFDVVINLAGANISKKWTPSYKKTLLSSRLKITKDVVDLVARLKEKPQLFISASAVGYYDVSEDAVKIDENTKGGSGFAHDLCCQWEECASKMRELNVRTCIVRLGVVLSKDGGALKKMLPPFYFGLGGKIGSGNQFFSWVHIEDVIRAFDYMVKNDDVDGVFNLTAPAPVTNAEFTKTMGRVLNRPTIFDMPAIVVKILFGEMGDNLLLKGNKVIPARLKKIGFKFKYNNIESALTEILK